jgi:hypothetical protein
LLNAEVAEDLVVPDRALRASREDAARRLLQFVGLKGRVERRRPARSSGQHVQILDLGIVARDLNAEVVLERQPDRFVGREAPHLTSGGGLCARCGLESGGEKTDVPACASAYR